MRLARAACPYAALLALTVVAYLPVWCNDFIDFDDPQYITDNPRVLGGLTMEGLRWAWTNDRSPYLQPLSWLSLQLDAELFASPGPNGTPLLPATAVHGHSLCWHALNSLLLFGLCRRLTGASGRSFLVAALFAVHPMHVESVAWAAERKDVLSVFFGLVAIWAYARYSDRPGLARYLVVWLALLLSLLSKPMLITLPFLLLLLDFWPLRRLRGSLGAGALPKLMPLHRLVLEKVPLFLLAAAIALLTMESREQYGSVVSLFDLSLPDRLANALIAYGWYLSSTLCPSHLALLYPHLRGNWTLLPVLAGAVVLLCVTLLARRRVASCPWLLVGWLWFVGSLLPVIGLAQGGRQGWADRFSYFPHIGLFLALVWGVAELAVRLRLPTAVRATAGALVLSCLLWLTQIQVGHWRNTITVWQQDVAVTSDHDYAHERLARAYFVQGQREEGEFHIMAAVRIQHKRLGLPFTLSHSPSPQAYGLTGNSQTVARPTLPSGTTAAQGPAVPAPNWR